MKIYPVLRIRRAKHIKGMYIRYVIDTKEECVRKYFRKTSMTPEKRRSFLKSFFFSWNKISGRERSDYNDEYLWYRSRCEDL